MKGFVLNSANSLTLARVCCVPVLWVVAILQQAEFFAGVIIFAGLTDLFDGFIARRFHQTSCFGSWFDSFADNLFGVSAVFWFWLLIPEFFSQHIVVILIMFGIFVLNMSVGFYTFGRIPAHHLCSSKVSSIVGYIFSVHTLLWYPSAVFFWLCVLFGVLNQCDEIHTSLTNTKIKEGKSLLCR
ncbi:MAG: CDP-alcohol phosphatidyltransferase family protein [Candidatus Woesearchaeota archaeon]|nr:CDP-alcohol phosphatidyltransferase family protein [Candidatus Woesearchaeota archaeon]